MKVFNVISALLLAFAASSAWAQDVSTSTVVSSGSTTARALKDRFADSANVLDFGAKCDGTDDAAAINRALTAMGNRGGGEVDIPSGAGCVVRSTVNVPANVILKGASAQSNGLIAGVTNLNPMIQINGNGAGVENLYINAGAAGTNTSGVAIATGVNTSQRIIDVQIDSPCVGFTVNGNSTYVDRVMVNGAQGSTCGGWIVGNLTTQAHTVDPRITNTTTGGPHDNPGKFGQLIFDAGGLFEANNDVLYGNFGTYIVPGANQEVDWAFFSNTVMGDTNPVGALVIDTGAATGVVKGLECIGCWAASELSSSSANILINNGGGGTITGLHFVGLRDFNSAGNGAYVNGGSNIYFEDSRFCGNATGKGNIEVTSAVTGFKVSGGIVGGSCDSYSTTPAHGIQLSSNSEVQIVGVDFTGVTTPILGAPTGNSLIANNIGLSTIPLSVASATSINIGTSSIIDLTGLSTVSTIMPVWNGRQVTLISTSGAIAYAASGNLCNGLTSVKNVPVLAFYTGTCWALK